MVKLTQTMMADRLMFVDDPQCTVLEVGKGWRSTLLESLHPGHAMGWSRVGHGTMGRSRVA